ncbi:EutP/PduV family microcompartment system protein [Sporosarcina sp. HYO08]|uniref:EutP/PduV family microcompartment system protein n=1 Tax=Sporosarcina sp. HYO08 TaxID=1759557 RepID=UPI00079B9D07|nr:EutP/PduV family microcompartment system protein [Sporosarcina sp. HYO08]KXH83832.1 ethanolamine utilization protein EutP [Sporosarcina sp. HYO08]
MKNRAMLIGAIDAGKSTLTNVLLGKDDDAVKTQTLMYDGWIVDTPGEYTENPMYYKNIMATAMEVTHVFYLQDATSTKTIFPPGFSSGIAKLSIGVITKCDHPEANIARSFDKIKSVITNGPIVITSAVEGKGINHLKELVQMTSMEQMRRYYEGNAEDDYLLYTDSLYTL